MMMLICFILFFLALNQPLIAFNLTKSWSSESFHVAIIFSENNQIYQKSFSSAFNQLIIDWPFLSISYHTLSEDASEDELCSQVFSSLNHPQFVVDATLLPVNTGSRLSSLVKRYSRRSAIPTISTSYSFGDEHDEWFNLDNDERQYLIHVHQPGDVIPLVVQNLIEYHNLSKGIILHDNSFILDHKLNQLIDSKYTQFMVNSLENVDLFNLLTVIKSSELLNYFVLAQVNMVNKILGMAASLGMFRFQDSWHIITKDRNEIKCANCTHGSIMFYQPIRIKSAEYNHRYSLSNISLAQRVDYFFYYDLARFIGQTIVDLKKQLLWPKVINFPICGNSASNKEKKERSSINLRNEMSIDGFQGLYGRFVIASDNDSNQLKYDYQEIALKMVKIQLWNFKPNQNLLFGEWLSEPPNGRFLFTGALLANKKPLLKIVTIKQPPFVMQYSNKTWYGYCIDLLQLIQDELLPEEKFDYELYESPNGKYGDKNPQTGKWDGIMGEIEEKRADIAIGGVFVMAEREDVVDFTVPYYDLVGISLLMKKTATASHMFRFLTVLTNTVWFSILCAYFFTSFIIYMFDRISPYSYRNAGIPEGERNERRQFTFTECLWFCMTSLTPQGGGEAPINYSGKLVAAIWWLFGFLVIASYTANLAAFLTVSRLDSPIDSLDKLAEQYRIKYAPVKNSLSMIYFQRMEYIEKLFFRIWIDMTLNAADDQWEKSRLTVWDYPMTQKYSDIWKQIHLAGMPLTFEEGVKRVKNSKHSGEGFTLLEDATQVRYAAMINCDLEQIGDEFSRKPLALAVQEGSPLKDQLSSAILKLLNKRKLESLKEKWWTDNPERKNCGDPKRSGDGISIKNIGGVFIVITVGVGLACITLIYEQCFGKSRRRSRTIPISIPKHRKVTNIPVATWRK